VHAVLPAAALPAAALPAAEVAARLRKLPEREIGRMLAAIGPRAAKIVEFCALGSQTVAAWCQASAVDGRVPNRQQEQGRLNYALERCGDYMTRRQDGEKEAAD